MAINDNKAAKHNEELSKMEAELSAEVTEPIEETSEVQEVEEQTTQEESATPEEKETSQTPEENVTPPTEGKADPVEQEELTPEEWDALSEKTRRQMTKLREKARLADELIEEREKTNKLAEVYAPLKELAEETKERVYSEPAGLPWNDRDTERAGMWAANLLEDISYAEREYPELNPDLEGFNDSLSGEILQDFRLLRKSQPDIRLKDFVDRRMRSIKAAKEEALKKVKSERAIEKQKAEEAPPANVSPPRKQVTTADKVGMASSLKDLEKLESELGISGRYK